MKFQCCTNTVILPQNVDSIPDDGVVMTKAISKAPVKLSPPANQHPTYYRPDAFLDTKPTVSKH